MEQLEFIKARLYEIFEEEVDLINLSDKDNYLSFLNYKNKFLKNLNFYIEDVKNINLDNLNKLEYYALLFALRWENKNNPYSFHKYFPIPFILEKILSYIFMKKHNKDPLFWSASSPEETRLINTIIYNITSNIQRIDLFSNLNLNENGNLLLEEDDISSYICLNKYKEIKI
jgi:hypothetical protein